MTDPDKIIRESAEWIKTDFGIVYCRNRSSESDRRNIYLVKDERVVWRVKIEDKEANFAMGFVGIEQMTDRSIKGFTFMGRVYEVTVETGETKVIGFTK